MWGYCYWSPSMANVRHRFRIPSLNFLGHGSFIWFMAIESVGIHITPDSLLCEACHSCNIANSLQWQSLWILGIIGMCVNILWGGLCDLPIFLNYGTYHAHISDISIFLHILLYIEYKHLDMHDMIVLNTQHFQPLLCLFVATRQDIITRKNFIFE